MGLIQNSITQKTGWSINNFNLNDVILIIKNFTHDSLLPCINFNSKFAFSIKCGMKMKHAYITEYCIMLSTSMPMITHEDE